MIKWAFLIVIVLCVGSTAYGLIYMNDRIDEYRQSIVVLDRNNMTYIGEVETLSAERRRGQIKRHVEMFWQLFWNVSQSRDNIEKSVNMALELTDNSGVRLYEKYYEVQNMSNFLYENAANSFVNIEEVQLDMSVYPYKGLIKSVHELETAFGNSLRRMDATFEIKNYPVSYENPAGAQIMNIEVFNEETIENE